MNPKERKEYLQWIVDELDGSYVERPANSDLYYSVEVTELEETDDGTLVPIEAEQ